MHMVDALVSPAVGGAFWAVSAVALGVATRHLQRQPDDRLVPMMGVMGAFVFAAQMVNFAIPGTGSSGHLGGGLLLALLLGPQAALLVMASVLAVQALLFADGGLLALGANIFNLGFLPAFVAYPLVFRPLAGAAPAGRRFTLATLAAAVVGLQLGALGVVGQTWLSGISDLPLGPFLLLMLPIHLAIGLVEGMATAAVVGFVQRTRPEALAGVPTRVAAGSGRAAPVGLLAGLLATALLVGGVGAWFASSQDDGLEWSLAGASGRGEIEAPATATHGSVARLQSRTAVLPDYGFAVAQGTEDAKASGAADPVAWPAVDAGTSVAGLVGGVATLVLTALLGLLLRRRKTAP